MFSFRWAHLGSPCQAAGLPELALAAGASVIHVNLDDVSLEEPNEFMLRGSATQVLPSLLEKLDALDW
jgi:NAD-dependent deacetylase